MSIPSMHLMPVRVCLVLFKSSRVAALIFLPIRSSIFHYCVTYIYGQKKNQKPSFKWQVSVIGRIEGVSWWPAIDSKEIYFSENRKIPAFPKATKWRDGNIFVNCSEKCPFWQIPIHSCQKGKDVAKCDTQENFFLEKVLFCHLPRLSGRREKENFRNLLWN